MIYFEALDLITSCIKDRFNQPGYKAYGKVQALLLKAATSKPYEEELKFALLLSTHLQIFSQTFKPDGEVRVTDLLSFFRGCTPGQLDLMSQVSKLVRLLLSLVHNMSQRPRDACVDAHRNATDHKNRLEFYSCVLSRCVQATDRKILR